MKRALSLVGVAPLLASDFQKVQAGTRPESVFNDRHEGELRATPHWTIGHSAAGVLENANAAPGVLEKTVFSSKIRMVFLVGLEGSGHHLMNSVLRKVCAFDSVWCPDVCHIAGVLYNRVSTPETELEYRDGLEELNTAMDALALNAHGSNDSERVALATFSSCNESYHVGTMSYPVFGGEDKAIQQVDLRILAAEAERVNVDLRVVYLSRSAEEILASTTEHRHFGRWVGIYATANMSP